jgi:hypothetical protein
VFGAQNSTSCKHSAKGISWETNFPGCQFVV